MSHDSTVRLATISAITHAFLMSRQSFYSQALPKGLTVEVYGHQVSTLRKFDATNVAHPFYIVGITYS